MSNPYLELFDLMGKNGPKASVNFFICELKNVDKFEVVLNDIVLDKDDLLIDSRLKTEELLIGDTILVLKINDNYIAMCKVVSI